MRVSFDIDDTIVRNAVSHKDERAKVWVRWLFRERLRPGTLELFRALRARGCDIWLYTTSHRSAWYLQSWFWSLGVPLDGVVNQTRHDSAVARLGPSKWPPAFGIDVHVDDLLVAEPSSIAGRFELVVIEPADTAWSQKVLAAVDALLQASPAMHPTPQSRRG